jgi:hypothetical protein
VTGTIVGLPSANRTGIVRSSDGSRLVFAADAVLGDFGKLALGDIVSYESEPARPHAAVRIFREVPASRSRADAIEDLRFIGFTQAASVRTYQFEAVTRGYPARQFSVTVDVTLLLKHHVGVQDAPALCLRKLSADLKKPLPAGAHELGDDDLRLFASSRDAAHVRRAPKHSSVARSGSQPPAPAAETQSPKHR